MKRAFVGFLVAILICGILVYLDSSFAAIFGIMLADLLGNALLYWAIIYACIKTESLALKSAAKCFFLIVTSEALIKVSPFIVYVSSRKVVPLEYFSIFICWVLVSVVAGFFTYKKSKANIIVCEKNDLF